MNEYAAPDKECVMKQIREEAIPDVSIITTTASPKQKSVVKSAVVGGIVAGGAGAVVGAIAASNHNNKAVPTKKTTYIATDSGKTDVFFHFRGKTIYNYRFKLNSTYYPAYDETLGGIVYTAQGVQLDDVRIDSAISNLLDKIWK